MQEIDLETSIRDFLLLGRQYQSLKSLTGERVLSELTSWYKESRIIGASLLDNGDMLLLQWGITYPIDISEPTDLRGVGDGEIKFSDSKFQYLNFTRQVFANFGDEEVEFDNVAIQMCISLYYGLATEKENSDSFWIEMPNGVEHGEERFLSESFVNMLIKIPASRVEIIVEQCG